MPINGVINNRYMLGLYLVVGEFDDSRYTGRVRRFKSIISFLDQSRDSRRTDDHIKSNPSRYDQKETSIHEIQRQDRDVPFSQTVETQKMTFRFRETETL